MEKNKGLNRENQIWLALIAFTIVSLFVGEGNLTSIALILLFVWLYIWICISVAKYAKDKNRNFRTTFILCLLFSPLLIGIIVAVMPDSKR